MTLEIDRPIAVSSDETDAFRFWWSQTHDWDHTDTGLYEQRFKAAFVAGWRAAREGKTEAVLSVEDVAAAFAEESERAKDTCEDVFIAFNSDFTRLFVDGQMSLIQLTAYLNARIAAREGKTDD